MTVLGTHGVGILDLRHAGARTVRAGWTLTGAGYTHLTDGDHDDARRRSARPAPGKRPLTPSETSPVPANNDVLHSAGNPAGVSHSFLSTAAAVAATRNQRTASATTYENAPRFTVTFTKRPGFTAWTSDGTTARSLSGLGIDVAPR